MAAELFDILFIFIPNPPPQTILYLVFLFYLHDSKKIHHVTY